MNDAARDDVSQQDSNSQSQVSGVQDDQVSGRGQVQQASTQGGAVDGKEREPIGGMEQTPLVEVSKHPELEPEVEGWLEKVERGQDQQLTQPVMHDDSVLVADAGAQVADDEVIVLPLTREEVEEGLHHKVWDGVRWLAEWCVRVVKMVHGKVRYREG